MREGLEITETEVANERRMRQYVEAWNDRDPDRALGMFADGDVPILTGPSGNGEEHEPGALRETWEAWVEGFPDLRHDLRALAADGEWVLGWGLLRGTHEGTFRGIPASGTEVEVALHVATRFRDGEIVEHHATADVAGLLAQLDARVAPARIRAAENEAIVRRFFLAANETDREALLTMLAEDVRHGDREGREAVVAAELAWQEAFPDLTYTLEAVHAGDVFVTARWTVTGTHEGEILGIAPTGESIEVTGLSVARIRDRRITEWWAEWDYAGMLEQLGAIDAPGD